MGAKNLSPGMTMHEFSSLASLEPDSSQTVTIGINFNDSTQSAKFDLVASGRVFTVQIQPQIGELIRGVSMPESLFDQEKVKLKGMNQVDTNFDLPSAYSDEAGIKKKIYETANVVQVHLIYIPKYYITSLPILYLFPFRFLDFFRSFG